MKYIYISMSLLYCLLSFSCKEQKIKSSGKYYHIGDILNENNEICLDSVSQSISVIRLETSDDILIDKINYIRMYKNMLFVVHHAGCSAFDLNGKFLYHLGNKGNGPDEYLYLKNLIFTDEYVIIYDDMKKMLFFYNSDAEFICNVSFLEKCTDFKLLDANILVAYIDVSYNAINRLIFFDLKGKIIDSVKQDVILSNDKSAVVGNDGKFFSYNNIVYFKEGYNDTVYQISLDLRLIPDYVVNTGKYSVSYEDRMLNFEQYIKGISPVVFFENDRYIILHGLGLELQYILIDKQSGRSRRVDFKYNDKMEGLFEDDRIVKGAEGNKLVYKDIPPYFRIRGISEDGKLLLDFEYLKAEPDANPVIVLVKLKE